MQNLINEKNTIYSFLKEKIKPSRYLWHVTKKCDIFDYSIAKDGIICPKGYAVFANHNLHHLLNMYPISIDCNWEDYFFIDSYSFWRIDTYELDVQWYIDPFMKGDLDYFSAINQYNFNPSNFVCTPHSIPSYALELYEIYSDTKFNPFIKNRLCHLGQATLKDLDKNSLMNYFIKKQKSA